MRVLLRQIARGLTDLGRNPLAQLMTLAGVTLTTFLAGLFLLFVINLNAELLSAKGNFAFQIYWEPAADMDAVHQQWAALDAMEHFAGKKTYTPAQAMDELALSLDSLPDDLRSLAGGSPLPATAVAWFSSPPGMDPEAFAQGILRHLARQPGVADVHYSAIQLGLAKAWTGFSHTVLWPVIGFLGLVAALIVGNTLRLALASRRDEVEILHLVGAGAWYIRLPLLVSGAVMGLVSGLLALALLKAVQLPLATLFDTPPLGLAIGYLPAAYALGLLAACVGICTIASLVAARAR